jgi:hypothetical protein
MDKDAEREEIQSRTAACSCRKLQIKVTGAPAQVNSCTCLECQRRSGSALTYTAFFPDSAIVSLDGEYRSWRQERDSGRWHESSFCLVCGTWVFSRLEVLPGFVGISVGCFADPEFEKPTKFFWASRRHRWLPAPKSVEVLDTQ